MRPLVGPEFATMFTPVAHAPIEASPITVNWPVPCVLSPFSNGTAVPAAEPS